MYIRTAIDGPRDLSCTLQAASSRFVRDRDPVPAVHMSIRVDAGYDESEEGLLHIYTALCYSSGLFKLFAEVSTAVP